MSVLVGDEAVGGSVALDVVVGGDVVGGGVAGGAVLGSGVRGAATGPGQRIVMQSTPIESGVRHLVFEQTPVRPTRVVSVAADAADAVGRSSARRRRMALGPTARPAGLVAPGGRPAQPARPWPQAMRVAHLSLAGGATLRAERGSRADDWELGSRGLAVVTVCFLVAVLCGLVVAVSAFLSIANAPLPTEVVGAVSVFTRAAV